MSQVYEAGESITTQLRKLIPKKKDFLLAFCAKIARIIGQKSLYVYSAESEAGIILIRSIH